MKPKRIILVRHGESEGNVDKVVHSYRQDYSIWLTPTGAQQSKDAGKEIEEFGHKNYLVYVSPYMRTRQTWENIKKSISASCTVYEDPRLREQEWKRYMNVPEFDQVSEEMMKFGPFYYRIDGGESCADVYNRVQTWIHTMNDDLDEHGTDNVIVVTHGMTLRVMLMALCRMTVEKFMTFKNPRNAQVVVLEINDGCYNIISEVEYREVIEPERR